MPSIAEQLKKAEEDLASAEKRGSSSVKIYEAQVEKLKKELEKPQPHPALQFGPYAQCIAIMSAISLMMSVCPIPYEMVPFYRIFSTVTIIAVACYASRTAVIYYGYTQALAKLPKPDDPNSARFAKLMASKKPRQDLWAHTRSHPSAFLTTRQAAPRLFPFPLGKTRPEAAIKDELWWEGGNAPHVGHFNRPKLPHPPMPDESVLMARVEASMKREAQEELWKKRIRSIQFLSVIVIISFVSKPISIALLCYLIYTTISSEIQSILTPPPDLDEVESYIQDLTMSSRNESAPRPTQMIGGMSYIYEPTLAAAAGVGGGVKHSANIPIEKVVPPVLMTTTNSYYAGPGPAK
ncbi:hypothetical protein CI109_103371 [Kwoniella shandongensis]|uniref:Uncharacterized protein n=1 Tax=Kwoniella shandongensis TaxID=1734106 RepID=A0A5M6BY72_9TREE|nr:uncharacterized protein CI109_004452 [Kwoniella shandongensis]KAA5527160.1 hypothetical protein CI109_004452 [Kwoniella shandongensis]